MWLKKVEISCKFITGLHASNIASMVELERLDTWTKICVGNRIFLSEWAEIVFLLVLCMNGIFYKNVCT